MLQSFYNLLKVYFDRRMPVMLALGFSSGFPLILVFSTMNLWLKDCGVAITVIGMMSLIKAPFSFKWVWAPFVDKLRLPLLGRLGQLRSWALLSQVVLMLGILGMSAVDVRQGLCSLICFAVIVVLASGTQDIVLDAYRIDRFKTEEQAAGAAVFVLGYRLGMIFSGAGALFLSEIMSWNQVYALMSLGTLVGITAVLCMSEPPKTAKRNYENVGAFIKYAVVAPLSEFLCRPHWRTMIAFIFFYRMSDAYMGPMAYLFFDDLGFSKSEIAAASKLYGMAATILGGFVGGAVLNRIGMFKGLLLCGILQSVTNLVYVMQAQVGNHFAMLASTIAFDNVAGGMSSIALVAYLSSLCNKKFTATQYALLSSLMSFARDIFSSTSGYLAQAVSWDMFFILTTLMGIPAVWLLFRLRRQRQFVSQALGGNRP